MNSRIVLLLGHPWPCDSILAELVIQARQEADRRGVAEGLSRNPAMADLVRRYGNI